VRKAPVIVTAPLLWLASVASGQTPQAAPAQTATPAKVELVALLDDDLAGWRLVPPLEPVRRPVDGVLALSRAAWLVHSRTRSDFVLNVEFRLGSDRARFGVLTRGWWEPGSGGADADYGYEWWLRSGKTAEFQLVIQEPTQMETIPHRTEAALGAILPPGRWQTLAIMATADRFQVWLNGVLVANAWGGAGRAGRVGLRARDGDVEVRNVGIRDLSAQPLFEEALEAGGQVPAPQLVQDVRPRYVAGAIKRRVEGEVVVECVVMEDGSVGAVRVLRALDPDLDAETLAAVRQWRFEPPRRDGVPVKVRFAITLGFGKNPRRGPATEAPREGATEPEAAEARTRDAGPLPALTAVAAI
jgi:TonB family protein